MLFVKMAPDDDMARLSRPTPVLYEVFCETDFLGYFHPSNGVGFFYLERGLLDSVRYSHYFPELLHPVNQRTVMVKMEYDGRMPQNLLAVYADTAKIEFTLKPRA